MVGTVGGRAARPDAAGARASASIGLQHFCRSGATRQPAGALCAQADERGADHHRRHRFVIDGRRGRKLGSGELSEPAGGRA